MSFTGGIIYSVKSNGIMDMKNKKKLFTAGGVGAESILTAEEDACSDFFKGVRPCCFFFSKT